MSTKWRSPPDSRSQRASEVNRKQIWDDHYSLPNRLQQYDATTLHYLRTLWWREATCGHVMPAQNGVIVIKGGAP